MSFDTNPVDAQQESFDFEVDPNDPNLGGPKSKYDFEGTFNCVVSAVKRGTSSNGNFKLDVKLVGQQGPTKGLLLDDALPKWKIDQLAAAVLPKGEDGKIKGKYEDLIDKTTAVTFKRETYNGKTRGKPIKYGTPLAEVNDGPVPF